MAKKIQGSNIIEDNHLDNAIKSGEELLAVYKKIDEQVTKTAKDMKKMSSAKGGTSAKGIQDLNKALSESTKQKQAAITVDKQKASLEVKLKALNSDKIQQLEVLKLQTQQQAKVNKQLAKEQLGLVGAYERESKQLVKLRKQLKDLVVAEGAGAKGTKKLKEQVEKLDQKLKKADAAAGQFQRNVGNYPKGLKGAIGSLKQFAGALGLVGGVQLFTKVLSSSFNTIKDFGQSIANLSAITGATGDDLEFYKQKAIEMGKSTTLSASQVAEGFKIIASAKPELLADAEALALVTEKSILLAEAAGIELPEAAAAVTNSLNQFGAGAEKTSEFVDVLAAGAKFGAGDINFLNEALVKAGTVASNANFSFSETASALELLAEKGMPASIAGTNLKGVILQLQKAGVGFASGQFDFNDALEETRVMLDGIKDPAERAAKEIKLFGSQNLAAGQTFLNGADRLAELNKNLGETGTAAEQAATNNDTLEGSLKLLASAWEGYILGADQAGGITDKLKGIVSFLAENLETILSTIGTVIKMFVTYKVVTFAVTKAMKLYNIVQKLATQGMKNFSKASALNPWGAIAAALVIVIPLVWDFVDGLVNAKDASNLLSRISDEVTDRLGKEKEALTLLGIELNATNAGSEERLLIINKINDTYGTTLENLDDETEMLQQLAAAYKSVVDEMEKKIRSEVNEEFLKDLIRQETEISQKLEKIQRDNEGKSAFNLAMGAIGGAADVVGLNLDLDSVREQIDILRGIVGKDLVDKQGGLVSGCTDPKASNYNSAATVDDGSCEYNPKGKGKGGSKGVKKTLIDFSEEEELLQFNARQQRREDNLKQEEENNRILEDNEKAHLAEIERLNKEQEDNDKKRLDAERKAAEQRLKDLKKMRDESLAIIKQITDDLAAEIDKRISKRQESITNKETEVARLQGLAAKGNTDAAEAIKAEKIGIAKEKIEIEKLEKRKKNLLISVAGLERASQLIGTGNSTPFATAGSEIKDFLGNLKGLSEGTDYNIGQTLGTAQRSGTDGHLMWADGREKLLSIKNSEKLGGMHQDEVTRRALAYNNDFVNGNAMSVTSLQAMTDRNIVNKLDSVEKAIKNMEFPTSIYDQATGKETIRKGNKTINIDHKPTTFKV